jgi:mannose-6-phosphate isomerase-like protein (cupin superfamily)
VSEVFELDQLLAKRLQPGKSYLEFLRVPAISAGVYVLSAGVADPQTPHTEDEIYYVISGKASIRMGEEVRSVDKGSVIFVESGVDHRFFHIEQELILLVVFGPAESNP